MKGAVLLQHSCTEEVPRKPETGRRHPCARLCTGNAHSRKGDILSPIRQSSWTRDCVTCSNHDRFVTQCGGEGVEAQVAQPLVGFRVIRSRLRILETLLCGHEFTISLSKTTKADNLDSELQEYCKKEFSMDEQRPLRILTLGERNQTT
jgi:hypothetical protein